jgi:hypothetical protein
MVISDSIYFNIPSVMNQNWFPYNGQRNERVCRSAGNLHNETRFQRLVQRSVLFSLQRRPICHQHSVLSADSDISPVQPSTHRGRG